MSLRLLPEIKIKSRPGKLCAAPLSFQVLAIEMFMSDVVNAAPSPDPPPLSPVDLTAYRVRTAFEHQLGSIGPQVRALMKITHARVRRVARQKAAAMGGFVQLHVRL
jgi:hypothetical protein